MMPWFLAYFSIIFNINFLLINTLLLLLALLAPTFFTELKKALTLGITNPYLQNTGNELVDVAEFIAGIYHDKILREQLEKADKGFIDRFLNDACFSTHDETKNDIMLI